MNVQARKTLIIGAHLINIIFRPTDVNNRSPISSNCAIINSNLTAARIACDKFLHRSHQSRSNTVYERSST